jgi:HPt (histidine-containing phosphotransfer) domain-containing protein
MRRKEIRVHRGKQLDEGVKLTLDVQHLRNLVGQASLEAAESFTAEYMALLPRFVEQLRCAIGARDRGLALDVSMNLKTKSWLVGALRMNQLCRELELALALGDWAVTTAVARDIELHLPRLQKALQGRPDLALRGLTRHAFQATMAS